jgi:hypothetical protein
MLQPTPEFRAMTKRLCQDIADFGRTEDEFYTWVLGDVNSSNAAALAGFLDKVLAPDRTTSEVVSVFNASPSDVFFKNAADIQLFLRNIRGRLNSSFGV